MLSGKRAPFLAGFAALVVAVLLVVVLVLPKLGQISDAKKKLDAARTTQVNLESQHNALLDAKNGAPAAQQAIDRVDSQIPPTADLPGLILLLRNSAQSVGVTYVTITPATPILDAASGLSAISVTVGAEGTYFALTDYLYKIETLPRAAKVLSATVATGATTSKSSSILAMTATLVVYTADTSAGPGSTPGPQVSGGSPGTGG